jgi:hypothetical protein
MEKKGKIILNDHVRNEEVLLSVKEEKNSLHTINKRKANWIGHILSRNCLLKCVIEGKIKRRIEVTGRTGKRPKDLMDGLEGKRVCWKLEAETLDCALDSSLWKKLNTVVRQTTERIKDIKLAALLYVH